MRYLACVIGLFLALLPVTVAAIDMPKLQLRVQENIESIDQKLEKQSVYKKIYTYTRLGLYIEKYLYENTLAQEQEYVLRESLLQLYNKKTRLQELTILSENFNTHNTLTLSFNNHTIDQVLANNTKAIQQAQSVFLFRDSSNLSLSSMKSITGKIQELHADIIIFTDQEGGQINRYKDFDQWYTRDTLLEEPYIQLRKSRLSWDEYRLFLSLFPQWLEYFPSFGRLGRVYDDFSPKSAKIMLEMFAYMRLKSHSDTGINTYWLVTDLNWWNPSITPLERSFSRHSNKYRVLLDAFAKASKETGVLVYLKHFPGVGLGSVDSHNWVLDLRNDSDELSENMELFAYAQESFWSFPLWVMIWHALVSLPLQKRFNEIVKKFSFIITDDLGMKGYTDATGNIVSNWFFSTDEIVQSKKLFRLDRRASFYIK